MLACRSRATRITASGPGLVQEPGVEAGGELLAVVGPGNFVRMDVEPGKHTVLSKGGGINPPIPAKTAIDARANRLHFLGTWMVMGFSTNSIAHKIVSKEKGINDLNRSKMVETF